MNNGQKGEEFYLDAAKSTWNQWVPWHVFEHPTRDPFYIKGVNNKRRLEGNHRKPTGDRAAM